MVPSGRHGVAKGMERLLMTLHLLLIGNKEMEGESQLKSVIIVGTGKVKKRETVNFFHDRRIWCYEKVAKQVECFSLGRIFVLVNVPLVFWVGVLH